MNVNIFTHDLRGIWLVVPDTLLVSVAILALGIVLGMILYVLQQRNNFIIRSICRLYVSYFRGVPLLIHLLIFYYGLPVVLQVISTAFNLHINYEHLNPIYAVLLSYTMYSSSFISEIIRGSFMSVGQDQIEAATALGYSRAQAFWKIKLPQSLNESVPKFLNYYVLLIRQLSLAFMVSFVDIFAKAKLESAINYRYIESFCAAAVVYWILCVVLTFIFKKYENYLRRYEKVVVV
ncbi:amino acid ABC transporter permease [Paucilactobacillus suebicus]|uniref:Amino acid ABC transporter permease n=1 Tax=Paucilactobacillus suebicus DSM 5007 = KCTC 3549 TaxID=1423807 RepID=A0A0R1VX98_9LACO|nr:amino acid ABC transporter permease [Paucilactobacillus suebicus]KRM10305.1 amino acid ABC transporter permease [Paucilactobacillus suebicus DSM 5007 = KCTC 3549]